MKRKNTEKGVYVYNHMIDIVTVKRSKEKIKKKTEECDDDSEITDAQKKFIESLGCPKPKPSGKKIAKKK